ncbi:MAG: hypothetical protein FJX45_16255, partial [Alphaproteobacteria bacterium]|nr:hypothetical protein [Alphaproteobacteria bacterium]
MFRNLLARSVSAGAMTLALTSLAAAQQTLPTIDVGGAQPRGGAARSAPSGRGGAAARQASPAPADGPSVASRFASEPKTPTQ